MASGKKVLKIVGIVLAGIVGLLLVFYAVLWIVRAAMYKESMELRQYVCDVPETNSGYAPQGFCNAKKSNGDTVYLATGYDSNNISVLYVIEDNVSRRVRLSGRDLLSSDKEDFELKGHAGGITCTKDCVYISNGGKLYIYSLSAILANNGEDLVPCLAIAEVNNAASYCFSNDDHIYVGEFYRPGNYETDETHHYTTPAGDENKAIISCYKLNSLGFIASIFPEYCISVTGLVQGFATDGETFMLSRSYGLKNSSLDYYTAPVDSGKTLDVDTKKVPLLYLDSSNLFRTIVLPPFSEDMTIEDGRVIVTNESACNKYIVGKLFGGWKVYSYPIFKSE